MPAPGGAGSAPPQDASAGRRAGGSAWGFKAETVPGNEDGA